MVGFFFVRFLRCCFVLLFLVVFFYFYFFFFFVVVVVVVVVVLCVYCIQQPILIPSQRVRCIINSSL